MNEITQNRKLPLAPAEAPLPAGDNSLESRDASTLHHYYSLSLTSLQPNKLACKYRGNIVASNNFQQQCCLVYDGLNYYSYSPVDLPR